MAQGPVSAAPPAPNTWRDLRVRVISAMVMGPLGLVALWYGGPAWNGLILVLGIGCAFEWQAMARAADRRASLPASLALGLLYVGPAVVALIWLRDLALTGRPNVLFLVVVVWCSDIGAYLIGRLVGGRRLAPRISPGKTWSGAVGGLAAALLVGWVATAAWGLPPAPGLLVSGALGVVSQAGDLLESAIKRHFGVKDSGRLIPGHGGLLDRLDGLLAAAPVAAALVWIFGQGKLLWQ